MNKTFNLQSVSFCFRLHEEQFHHQSGDVSHRRPRRVGERPRTDAGTAGHAEGRAVTRFSMIYSE